MKSFLLVMKAQTFDSGYMKEKIVAELLIHRNDYMVSESLNQRALERIRNLE